MIKFKNLTVVAVAALLMSGCSLYEQIDIEETAASSEAETTVAAETTEEETTSAAETTTAEDIVINVETTAASKSFGGMDETVEYESLTLAAEATIPTKADGTWTDYILDAGDHDDVWKNDEKDLNVEYLIKNAPYIRVTDAKIQNDLNDKLISLYKNNYTDRFQMWDLNVQLDTTVLNQSRICSFQFEGTVHHVETDTRYETDREYRYYLTIDRMTADQLNLETIYGVMNAYNDIASGNYTVVSADQAVFDNFTNEELAEAYVYAPMFDDDLQHCWDFFVQGGKVGVCIWVGADKGNYAILLLNGTPLYS